MKSALIFLLIFSALFFWPLTFEQFETPKSWALIGFSCFAAFHVNWKKIFHDKIAATLFLFLISCALSSVFSINRNMSFWGNQSCPNGMLINLSYFIVYLAISSKSFNQNKILIRTIIFCAGVMSTYAVCQVFGIDFMTWHGIIKEGSFARPPSTLGHPNFMAAYLAMVLPFVIDKNYISKTWLRRSMTAFVGIVIILSQSRGMWIAALAGLSAYGFSLNTPLKLILKGFLASVLLFGLIFVSFKGFREGAQYRVKSLFSPGEARIAYPAAALKIWKQHPFIGSGLDTFETAFQHKRTARYWEVEKTGSPTRAHCEPLNILATQGIFGFIVVILLTLLIIKNLISFPNASLAGGITAFYVQNLSSFTIISTGILFMLFLGLLKRSK